MEKEIVVLKYGSSSVTHADGMDSERLDVYAGYVNSLMEK